MPRHLERTYRERVALRAFHAVLSFRGCARASWRGLSPLRRQALCLGSLFHGVRSPSASPGLLRVAVVRISCGAASSRGASVERRRAVQRICAGARARCTWTHQAPALRPVPHAAGAHRRRAWRRAAGFVRRLCSMHFSQALCSLTAFLFSLSRLSGAAQRTRACATPTWWLAPDARWLRARCCRFSTTVATAASSP